MQFLKSKFKQIELSQNKYALISSVDYEYISQWKWSYDSHGYARRLGKDKKIYMHRILMNPPTGKVVDHINGDKLDNRRSNLRICNHAENLRNHKPLRNNTSGFIGVSRSNNKWRAYAGPRDSVKHLGTFDTPEEAARVRDAFAAQTYGEFAKFNFEKG